MLNQESSVEHFREELLEWVKFRRRMADGAEELPTAGALERLAVNSITNELKNARIEDAKPDVFSWSLLSAVYISGDSPCIALAAHQKTGPFLLVSYPLDIRKEVYKGKEHLYVHDIGETRIMGSFPSRNGFLTAESSLEDVIYYAAKVTATLPEKEPALRWLNNVPLSVRTRHPICPKCGREVVYIGEFTEGSYPEQDVKRACCGGCGWVSKHKYTHLSEFVEEEDYRKELAAVRAEADAKKTVTKAQEDLNVVLKRLHEMCKDRGVMRYASFDLKNMLKKASMELAEINAEAEAFKAKKKK